MAAKEKPLFEGFDPRSDRADTRLTSGTETARVHDLYVTHIRARMDVNDTTEVQERHSFAADWIDLAEKEPRNDGGYLRVPGENARRGAHTRDVPPEQRKREAADLQLRWLLASDRPLPDWALIGIECVICWREGKAFPGGYYQAQGKLL